MMAKLHGKKRWNDKPLGLFGEAMALEIKLDSAHQRIQKGKPISEAQISRMLGHARTILALIGHEQKTLKRWTKPAPNQMQVKAKS
jgi:hypothetical protein